MVQEDSPSGSMIRKDIDQIVKASHRAKNLVKQILAFSCHTDQPYTFSNWGNHKGSIEDAPLLTAVDHGHPAGYRFASADLWVETIPDSVDLVK